MDTISDSERPAAGFLSNVRLVFLSQIAIYGLAFGLRAVLARGLGDSGLGTYSLFFLAVVVAGGVANLGVGLGNIYFLNKNAFRREVLLSGSISVLLSTALLAWLILICWALVAWSGSFVIADAGALALIGPSGIKLSRVLRPDWAVLKEQIRYGAQGQVANLAQLFNYRLDQFLVAAFVSRAGVGHYNVAVGLGESVWWISSAVALVLMPRLTGMDRERAREVTPAICRNTLAVSALGAILLVAVSKVAIRILFGSEFNASFTPLVLLMPGIVAASANRVLGSYLFSQGRIIYNTYATFIALGVTLALDMLLIPTLEVNGAAIASSVAYTASLIATIYWYRGVSGGSAAAALLPRPSDIHIYTDILQRLLGRSRRAENEAA